MPLGEASPIPMDLGLKRGCDWPRWKRGGAEAARSHALLIEHLRHVDVIRPALLYLLDERRQLGLAKGWVRVATDGAVGLRRWSCAFGAYAADEHAGGDEGLEKDGALELGKRHLRAVRALASVRLERKVAILRGRR